MLFATGTRVKFLHTGDEGIVKGRLDDGMVNVYIPDIDMEIPAAEEDLMRAESIGKPKVKAKIVQGKKEVVPPKAPPVTIETQYAILKSLGFQLAFLPVENKEGLTEKYLLYLLNDTSYDVIYSIKLLLNYRTKSWDGKLPATSYLEMGDMLYDDLNEAPEFEIECSWITTEGVGDPLHKTLKIKAKTFFKAIKTIPLLNRPAHLYRIFERPGLTKEKPKEDLQTYTKRHSKPAWQRDLDPKVLDQFSSTELAEFEVEFDLHIDKLLDDWQRIPKGDILRIQLDEFDKYLEKAIGFGVSSVFIIHGVGEGRLRDAVATRLMQNPNVETFKNEFHPRYGWGATEVIF